MFELRLGEFLNLCIRIGEVGYIFLLACLILIFLIFGIRYFVKNNTENWEIDEAELGIGSHRIKLKANNDDIQIAYSIWVELSTRKIGIKIDPEKDVILEVYNSWYQFFGITRELIKSIPVSKIHRPATRKIVQLSIDILNQRMRPHLTQWQAIFRKWYQEEIDKETGSKKSGGYISPQEIQKKFPQYDALIEDLIKVNENLANYCKLMQTMVMGSRPLINDSGDRNEK